VLGHQPLLPRDPGVQPHTLLPQTQGYKPQPLLSQTQGFRPQPSALRSRGPGPSLLSSDPGVHVLSFLPWDPGIQPHLTCTKAQNRGSLRCLALSCSKANDWRLQKREEIFWNHEPSVPSNYSEI
jgi:hypothetical protein